MLKRTFVATFALMLAIGFAASAHAGLRSSTSVGANHGSRP
ncbi:MAG: hypothetical protein U1E53_34010 [Dongiaceae bacterium]